MSTEYSEPLDPLPQPTPDRVENDSEPAPVEEAPVQFICWRCGLLTIEALRCSHCAAFLQKEAAQTHRKQEARGNPRLFTLIVAYALILVSSIVYSMAIHGSKKLSREDAETSILYVEAFDLVITLSLFAFLGWRSVRRPSGVTRALTWCLAPLASVGMFFLGKWYVEIVRQHFSVEWMHTGRDIEMTWMNVMLMAVQPAIVEELFFRYFAYGTLRRITNVHSAVVLSSLMFALAHLYNPLGLPFLFGMGILLGYARAYSGGLLLPMLMHFGHNFAILYLEIMT